MTTNRLHIQTHLKAGAECLPNDPACQFAEMDLASGAITIEPDLEAMSGKECWDIAKQVNEALAELGEKTFRYLCVK
jgi:hypothetical protein